MDNHYEEGVQDVAKGYPGPPAYLERIEYPFPTKASKPRHLMTIRRPPDILQHLLSTASFHRS